VDPAIRLLRELVAINSVNPTLVPGAPGEAAIGSARPPPAAISAATFSSRSARRAQIATAAPSRANRSAVALPIPADAPVMAMTRVMRRG